MTNNPNTTVEMADAKLESPALIRMKLMWRSFKENWKIFSQSKIGMIGLYIVIIFAVAGFIVYPILAATVWKTTSLNAMASYNPVTGYDFVQNNPAPPSWAHLLGTDPLGRDILAQLLYSTPREFMLGIVAALITVIIGTLIGTVAAYFGGALDTFFMRVADIVLLFPFIPFLIVISGMMQVDLLTLALIIGLLSGFGGITIVLRSQALIVKSRPFIESAKISGASDSYIIVNHIIPNVMPLSFLYMMFNVTGAIFSEAVLSFFGLLNIKMSWGLMIYTADTAGYIIGSNIWNYWWLWLPAGASITLLCGAFYFIGRGLDEVVNPRLRKR
ncbi:MAG: ABC transporter permease [Mesoaciditoga sp.]|uniref:ABC transporter permease n=1 Tax=Athalassotoga sp. TaxID=2022597 RepID=UPI000CA91642|nr:MAG: ABC transporter permease [Mesoaciditoga sp.]PMP80328.1 MAG: ABC transporter permease [Mesoaciditoga sp.]HEU23720.1 ABC transporter permease [Mesoaciditoga lauensis]